MLFTTLHWIVFLCATFLAFHACPPNFRRALMLAASVYFYATWRAEYLALLFGQVCVDWACGYFLARVSSPQRRRAILLCSVVINLGSLALFKYYGLFSQSLAPLGVSLPPLEVELPLAISFFTFESMSYTIDVYRGHLQPVRSPLHLALFITWFPHLIAGPIIRPSELIPQLDVPKNVSYERFFGGVSLMLVGYLKKLLFADWFGRIADPAFSHPESLSALELLLGVYAYAFQIFCDFSAYTDIARGASRWFGIELPENFNAPYSAQNITDFWRRWHMTLSHWLRDYLYVSLGGNRRGNVRTYVNLLLTMLLGGLWHGASWSFMVWGGLHGLLLAIERALGVNPAKRHAGWSGLWRQALTFHLVCAAWIFFRAPHFSLAWDIVGGLAKGAWSLTERGAFSSLGCVALMLAYALFRTQEARLLALRPGESLAKQLVYALGCGAVLAGLMVLGASSNVFIYFQF